MKLDIRRPELWELEEITRLDEEAFEGHGYPASTMRQFFELAGPLLQVGVSPEGVVAFGIALVSAEARAAWFMALAVAEGSRRKGIGRAVAGAVIDAAGAMGIRVIRLTVDPENVGAVTLYEHVGFEREVLVSNYFGPGKHRLVMRRDQHDG